MLKCKVSERVSMLLTGAGNSRQVENLCARLCISCKTVIICLKNSLTKKKKSSSCFSVITLVLTIMIMLNELGKLEESITTQMSVMQTYQQSLFHHMRDAS